MRSQPQFHATVWKECCQKKIKTGLRHEKAEKVFAIYFTLMKEHGQTIQNLKSSIHPASKKKFDNTEYGLIGNNYISSSKMDRIQVGGYFSADIAM